MAKARGRNKYHNSGSRALSAKRFCRAIPLYPVNCGDRPPVSGYAFAMINKWTLAIVAVLMLSSADAQTLRPPVVVDIVDTGAVVEDIAITGTVTARQFANISAAVAGQVTRVLVDAGDRVEAGAELVQLDAQIATLELQSAQATVAQGEAELADTRRRLADARTLQARNSISSNQVASVAAEVAIGEANLARLQADAARRAALVKRHVVHAPFAGVVVSKLTDAGAWVNPGASVIELAATQRLRLDFQAPQEYLTRIDDQAALLLRNSEAQLAPLTIETVVSVADRTTRTFLIRASAPDDAWAPGMSVNAVLRLGAGRSSMRISRDALVRYPDGRTTVWVVEGPDEGASVHEAQVQTGIASQGQVEILSGLSPGQKIVVRGNEALQEGQQVSIMIGRSKQVP